MRASPIRSRTRPLRYVLLIAACLLSVAPGQAALGAVVTTPFGSANFVGNPTWQPVDFNFFSNQLGSFDDFSNTVRDVFHQPEHLPDPNYGVKPGAAHAPPYGNEVSANVAAAGFTKKDVFDAGEFSGGRGVYLLWNVIASPSAPVGSSPDFASGRIIPNSLFPIVFGGQTLRNGSLFDPNWSGVTPALTGFSPAISGDGYSHFPFFTGEIFEFQDTDPDPNVNPQPFTDPAGLYVHQFTLTDAQGNGWRIDAPFTVAPEPTSVAVMSVSGFALLARGRSRRCRSHDPRP
jgi:hypothetical protein